jgi:hypothetical protein
MSYTKKSRSSYRVKKYSKSKKVNVVLALEGGHLGEIHVMTNHNKAIAQRNKLAKEHDLIGKQYMENHNKRCKDCRQCDLDEDEVHLHRVDIE